MRRRAPAAVASTLVAIASLLAPATARGADAEIPDSVKRFEKRVTEVVERCRPAFVAIGGGSGVIVSPDGWVVTNHHVAGGQKKWTIFRPGGFEHTATVRGHDEIGDITLLKIEDWVGGPLPFVPLGDSDALRVGQWVFALGNPWGFAEHDAEPTVTLGIVSAFHRYQGGYGDAIQTDAAVNPGNSGGPLIDLDGAVMGINGRIAVRFGERRNTGIGYAISAVQIARFLETLRNAGGEKVDHGAVNGLLLEEPPARSAEPPTGVIVRRVADGAKAGEAGLKAGDRIVEAAGYPVINELRWKGIVSTFPVGSSIEVVVMRAVAGDPDGPGARVTVTIEIEKGRSDDELTPGGNLPPSPNTPFVGLDFGEITMDGVIITGVYDGSPADEAGVLPGDVITHWNGAEALDRFQLDSLLSGERFGNSVTIRILRGQTAMTVELSVVNSSEHEGARLKARPTPGGGGAPDGGEEGPDGGKPEGGGPPAPSGPRPTPEALGLVLGDVDDTGTGIVVEEVTPDSASAKAGIAAGDVIGKWDGRQPVDYFDLDDRIRRSAPGSTVTVTVWRKGKAIEVPFPIPGGAPPEGDGDDGEDGDDGDE